MNDLYLTKEVEEQVKKWVSNKCEILSNHKLNDLKYVVDSLENNLLKETNDTECFNYLISKSNYCLRKNEVEPIAYYEIGSICYCDFGQAYIREIGYTHFGIVLSISSTKVFIVPMISERLHKSYNQEHTMRVERLNGLYNNMILYLNDSKWINSTRIIDVKGHINPESKLFKKIKNKVVSQILNGSQ